MSVKPGYRRNISSANSCKKKDFRERLGKAYEWFLELPVPMVLVLMWLLGAILVCLALLVLLFAGRTVLLRLIAGA